MQNEPAFRVFQSRPHRLSDPGSDFAFWPERLKQLLAVRDQDLNWADFQALLGPYLPAGTYDEVIYYLPLALNHLRDHTKEAGDMVDAVVGFCSCHVDQLSADGYVSGVETELARCLSWWTREFKVQDQSAENVGLVRDFLASLHRFERFQNVGSAFIRDLSTNLSHPVSACWFVSLAREHYIWPDLLSPTDATSLTNPEFLSAAVATVVEQALTESTASYWNDTLRRVGF